MLLFEVVAVIVVIANFQQYGFCCGDEVCKKEKRLRTTVDSSPKISCLPFPLEENVGAVFKL